MLYHYTDRDSAADILRDGVLRAYPIIVRATLMPGPDNPEIELAPGIWFTVEAQPAPTVLAKLQFGGWPITRPGIIWRIAVADEVAPLDLPAWAFGHGYAPDAFRFMRLTAQLGGEDWENWRLASADVAKAQWAAVESLHGDEWRRSSE